MLRNLSFAVACAALLALVCPPPAGAEPAPTPGTQAVKSQRAEPAKPKRRINRYSKDYGFLPGYEPPPTRPLYGPSAGYGDGPRFWYAGRYYYGWGGPRYYRGRWNGGSFGPCWTQTPIGPMWNCGR